MPMTWTAALAAAERWGHQMDEVAPVPAFTHRARCRRCGRLLLALHEGDAFGDVTRHPCGPASARGQREAAAAGP